MSRLRLPSSLACCVSARAHDCSARTRNRLTIADSLSWPDIPVGTKASNVLHYSQEQLTPVLEYFKGFILKKKDEAAKEADTAKEKVTTNGSS